MVNNIWLDSYDVEKRQAEIDTRTERERERERS